MPVWMRLGLRAYVRSFFCRACAVEGGGRDFFWITLLLALVMTLALLSVGGRVGFVDRLTDTLLGVVHPHGAPIWVTAHWENHEGIRKSLLDRLSAMEIATETVGPDAGGRSQVSQWTGVLVDRVRQQIGPVAQPSFWPAAVTWPFGPVAGVEQLPEVPGAVSVPVHLAVHPYRALTGGSPGVQLLDSRVWSRSLPFTGWAVYPDHPFWPRLETGSGRDGPKNWMGLPLTVVLNEALFNLAFDYNRYRDSMTPILAAKGLPAPPPLPSSGRVSDVLRELWLAVSVANEDHILRFDVHWVSHIPAIEKVAFLFPLGTYHAFIAAHHLPELRYEPEKMARAAEVRSAVLGALPYTVEEMQEFARCVRREVRVTGLNSLPRVSEAACQKPAGIASRLAAGRVGPAAGSAVATWMDHDARHQLWMPCYFLPRNDALRGSLCGDGVDRSVAMSLLVPWDMTGYGTPFSSVQMFVPKVRHLHQAIERISALRSEEGVRAFNIHPMYQDALGRFNLLYDLLNVSVPVYVAVALLLLLALLTAQIGALLDHRRLHYGILLSRGITWQGIYAKLLLQMLLASGMGTVIAAAVLFPAIHWLLGFGVAERLQVHQQLLAPGQTVDLMPMEFGYMAGTVGVVVGVTLLVTLLLIRRLPLTRHSAPSDLLHGRAMV
jgi:hypothetical protein